MKAMVLAAGRGTRLKPITDSRPKALVEVAGRPMIEYALLLLRHYRIEEIIINLHHFGAQIEEWLGDGSRLGLKIVYSRETELLDTGGGLLKARPFLQDECFIVINTDALIDVNLADVIGFHRERKAAATLVLRPDENAEQYGSMDVDERGRICRFLKTRAPFTPAGATRTLMFTGVQVIEPAVFDFMSDAARKFSTTRATYPKMLSAGALLAGFSFQGFWQDLGTVERIRAAEATLAAGRAALHYL